MMFPTFLHMGLNIGMFITMYLKAANMKEMNLETSFWSDIGSRQTS